MIERPEKPDGESGGTDQKEEVPYQIIENIILATDIHYFDPSLTDYGPRFQEMVEYGDGKVVTYIDEITDAFLEEVIQLRPQCFDSQRRFDAGGRRRKATKVWLKSFIV